MKKSLEDQKVNTRIIVALAWTSIMFCFVYADYFELYVPDKISSMIGGNIRPLGPVSQAKLLGTSIMLLVPALMVFLTLILKAVFCSVLNIIVASIYIILTLLVIQDAWYFYMLFGVVEILLMLTIIHFSWRWPRNSNA